MNNKRMETQKPVRRAVAYARISVSMEASVSIERQLEACRAYARARGWQLVGEHMDDGVSATDNRPEDRPAWRELMASADTFDAVIVWKLDRLARRTVDFLQAHQTLQDRAAAVVSVEDNIDMTTAQGRAFATVLASFAELEAETISSRVAAARSHLLRAGRAVGGTVPFGWQSVENPNGPGRILQQDPDRINTVRGMVERVQRGSSIYSIVQWLNDARVPTATGRGIWRYATVERLLRHPILAGLTPFNPKNAARSRGPEVLRGTDGLPVVSETLALLPLAEWRALVRLLDSRDSPQSKPRAMRSKTSPLLSGLVYCGLHVDDIAGTRMYRGTVQGRPGYYCPVCHQVISNFEQYAIEQFLANVGNRVLWSVVEEVHEGAAAQLPEIEHRLAELADQLREAEDDDVADRLEDEMRSLRRARRTARSAEPEIRLAQRGPAREFSEAWAEASTPEDQRAVLGHAIDRVWILPGRPGRATRDSMLQRLAFDWNPGIGEVTAYA